MAAQSGEERMHRAHRWAAVALLTLSVAVFSILRSDAAAATLTTIYNIQKNDGLWGGIGQLVIDQSGRLYGTISPGGGLSSCKTSAIGCGTVIQLTKQGSSWTKNVLYTFTGGADGAFPGDV